jgi:hypothetical protein
LGPRTKRSSEDRERNVYITQTEIQYGTHVQHQWLVGKSLTRQRQINVDAPSTELGSTIAAEELWRPGGRVYWPVLVLEQGWPLAVAPVDCPSVFVPVSPPPVVAVDISRAMDKQPRHLTSAPCGASPSHGWGGCLVALAPPSPSARQPVSPSVSPSARLPPAAAVAPPECKSSLVYQIRVLGQQNNLLHNGHRASLAKQGQENTRCLPSINRQSTRECFQKFQKPPGKPIPGASLQLQVEPLLLPADTSPPK